jgi:hypothetical protein
MSAFNPFEHYAALPFNNIWSAYIGDVLIQPRADVFMMGGKTEVATAIPDQQSSVTYWMLGADDEYHQVSEAQAFAQDLWLHFAFGKPVVFGGILDAAALQGLTVYEGITPEQLVEAIATLDQSWRAAIMASYTPDQIVAYAESAAPAMIDLVGVGWA